MLFPYLKELIRNNGGFFFSYPARFCAIKQLNLLRLTSSQVLLWRKNAMRPDECQIISAHDLLTQHNVVSSIAIHMRFNMAKPPTAETLHFYISKMFPFAGRLY